MSIKDESLNIPITTRVKEALSTLSRNDTSKKGVTPTQEIALRKISNAKQLMKGLSYSAGRGHNFSQLGVAYLGEMIREYEQDYIEQSR